MNNVTCNEKSTYKYRFAVNRSYNWQQKIGRLLRLLAQKIDGRHSLSIEMVSEPPIGIDREHACIFAGLKVMESSLIDEVKDLVLENSLKKAR